MNNDQSELEAWLAELEAEMAARAVVIASIKQKLGLTAEASPAGSAPAVTAASGVHRSRTDSVFGPLRSDSFFGLSVPDAIRKYLAMVKRPQPPKDIAAALKLGGVLSQATNFYANVTTSLKRLRDVGIVVNTGEGWGLAEWYPNRSRQGDSGAPRAVRARAVRRREASAQKVRHRPSRATGWHQFLGEAAKQGKTMAEAAKEWKAIRGKATP